MFTVGLGLLGATLIIMVFQNTSSAILVGFGFGGSLLALFLRVGGGIFTKAADVGADLVGKVEAGIPEDDPRNPATIADNVGDNVGDCAGMAADLFECYEVTLVASIILGVAAFESIGPNPALGLVFPLVARAIGVLASIAGVFTVRATDKDKTAMAPINRGFITAGVLTVIGTVAVALFYVGNEPRRLQRGLARCSPRWWRARARPGREPADRVLHVDRDHAGAGDRRVHPHRPGHDGALRHLVGARVLGVGRARHRGRHRRGGGAGRRQHPVLALPGALCRHGHAGHHRRGRDARTRSGRWPTTPPASPRCPASSRASPSGSW